MADPPPAGAQQAQQGNVEMINLGGVNITPARLEAIANDILANAGTLPLSDAVYPLAQQAQITTRFKALIHAAHPTLQADNDAHWEKIIIPICVAFAITGTSPKARYRPSQTVTIVAGANNGTTVNIPMATIKRWIERAAPADDTPNKLRRYLKGFSADAIVPFRKLNDRGTFNHLGGKWGVPKAMGYLAVDFLIASTATDDTETEILRQKTKVATAASRASGDVMITNTSQLGRHPSQW